MKYNEKSGTEEDEFNAPETIEKFVPPFSKAECDWVCLCAREGPMRHVSLETSTPIRPGQVTDRDTKVDQ